MIDDGVETNDKGNAYDDNQSWICDFEDNKQMEWQKQTKSQSI